MGRRRAGESAKRAAFAGVAAALALVCLYVAAAIPAVRMSALSVTLLLMMAAVSEGGARYGWSVYAVTVALSFLLAPDKLAAAMYAVFFGLYPLVKYEIESRCRVTWIGFVLKLVFLNAVLACAYVFARALLGDWLPVWLVWLAAQPLFLALDVVASRLILYYERHVKRR